MDSTSKRNQEIYVIHNWHILNYNSQFTLWSLYFTYFKNHTGIISKDFYGIFMFWLYFWKNGELRIEYSYIWVLFKYIYSCQSLKNSILKLCLKTCKDYWSLQVFISESYFTYWIVPRASVLSFTIFPFSIACLVTVSTFSFSYFCGSFVEKDISFIMAVKMLSWNVKPQCWSTSHSWFICQTSFKYCLFLLLYSI